MNLIYLLMVIGVIVSVAIGFKNRAKFVIKPNFGDYIVMSLVGLSIGLAIGLIIVVTLLLTH